MVSARYRCWCFDRMLGVYMWELTGWLRCNKLTDSFQVIGCPVLIAANPVSPKYFAPFIFPQWPCCLYKQSMHLHLRACGFYTYQVWQPKFRGLSMFYPRQVAQSHWKRFPSSTPSWINLDRGMRCWEKNELYQNKITRSAQRPTHQHTRECPKTWKWRAINSAPLCSTNAPWTKFKAILKQLHAFFGRQFGQKYFRNA